MNQANISMMIISGFCDISFGLERIFNHNLYFGGLFFIILGIMVAGFAIAQVYWKYTTMKRATNGEPGDKEVH